MTSKSAFDAIIDEFETPEPVDLVQELGLDELPAVMSPKVLGDHIEVSATTLKRWRDTWPAGDCIGPAFVIPAGLSMIRYMRKDVATWLAATRSEDTHAAHGVPA